MVKICIILAFAIWAILEGIRDAHLFHGLSIAGTKNNTPHVIFTAHRLIFGALVVWITMDWVFCLGLSLCFPLCHNSIYYHFRHKLNPLVYPMGWKDHSTTSTALINFSFLDRLIMAIVGIGVLIASFWV